MISQTLLDCPQLLCSLRGEGVSGSDEYMLWLERLVQLWKRSHSCWWVLGTRACHPDISICSAAAGMTCVSARTVVSGNHETPSGLRHPARTMKHTKVSDFLKPVAGRHPRNAMGIWLCWDAASDSGSHAYVMLNMPCSAFGHPMPSETFIPGAGLCTVQNSEQDSSCPLCLTWGFKQPKEGQGARRFSSVLGAGVEGRIRPLLCSPPPPLSKDFLLCIAWGSSMQPSKGPPWRCEVSSGVEHQPGPLVAMFTSIACLVTTISFASEYFEWDAGLSRRQHDHGARAKSLRAGIARDLSALLTSSRLNKLDQLPFPQPSREIFFYRVSGLLSALLKASYPRLTAPSSVPPAAPFISSKGNGCVIRQRFC